MTMPKAVELSAGTAPKEKIPHDDSRIQNYSRETKSAVGSVMTETDPLPSILEMPGSTRIVRLCYPLSQQGHVLKTLGKNPQVKKIGALPLVRSAQDRFDSVQVEVDGASTFTGLVDTLGKENLAVKISLSKPDSQIISVSGCMAPLEMDLIENADDVKQAYVRKTFEKKPNPGWLKKGPEKFEIADPKLRLGPCSYLVISLNVFNKGTYNKKILNHLAVLSQSRDYRINFDQMGNLIMLALHERAAGRLLIWGSALRKITRGSANLMFGKGEIVTSDKDNLVIDNYLTQMGNNFLQDLGEKHPDFYSTDFYLQKMRGTRDETLARVGKADRQIMGFVPIEVIKKVEYSVGGGPDRLIGYEQEFAELRNAINPRSRTKLIFLEGSAGTGKSRLINEVTIDTPNVIKISIDPAGRNITGFSLVDFTEQLTQFIRYSLTIGNKDEIPAPLRIILDFNEKNENAKILAANRNPELVCSYCRDALLSLEEEIGQFTLLIDDIHHNDRHSDGNTMKIIVFLLSLLRYKRSLWAGILHRC